MAPPVNVTFWRPLSATNRPIHSRQRTEATDGPSKTRATVAAAFIMWPLVMSTTATPKLLLIREDIPVPGE